MKFTYVLARWEGTTPFFRILKDALNRQDLLIIPKGKYYLGGVSFMLKCQIITPYICVHYHLKEYFVCGPQIKSFPIIASGIKPHYSFENMRNIVIACCILHNFFTNVDNDNSLLEEVDDELLQCELNGSQTQNDDDYKLGADLRDNITEQMCTTTRCTFYIGSLKSSTSVLKPM
uniref:DDE Tnp4 domain-containing protein n=1 Tax=Cajanus cajan TaxID=3821 RepID=A0A151TF72_CAJCA|nr:hypothetical protein KK1_011935 [Cajanus cajan]